MKLFECETCQVLKEQLDYEREVNKELTTTLTSMLKPIPIINQTTANPREVSASGVTWRRRRAELERADRQAMQLKNTSPVVGKPDKNETVEQLEMQLGIPAEEKIQ